MPVVVALEASAPQSMLHGVSFSLAMCCPFFVVWPVTFWVRNLISALETLVICLGSKLLMDYTQVLLFVPK